MALLVSPPCPWASVLLGQPEPPWPLANINCNLSGPAASISYVVLILYPAASGDPKHSVACPSLRALGDLSEAKV